MQYLLAGYANWFNARHRRPGHLFLGRLKGELIEDEGWLLGSEASVERIKRMLKIPIYQDEVPVARRVAAVSVATVLAAAAAEIQVQPSSFAVRHGKHLSRALAAWVARRLTVATLRELAAPFGPGHLDSVRGLLNRAAAVLEASPQLRGQSIPSNSASNPHHRHLGQRNRHPKNTKNGSDPAQPPLRPAWLEVAGVKMESVDGDYMVGRNAATTFVLFAHPVARGRTNEYFERVANLAKR
jgi:hypothetical protein